MDENVQNSISTKDLFKEYDWYQHTFPELVQNSCDEFFEKNFDIKFVGLSKNINCLTDNDTCFVTKIGISRNYDMFVRFTDKAISVILNKILGQSKNKFNINKISELEAKIITSFNGFLYDTLKDELNDPDPAELKRTNFDVVHLTFIIKDKDAFRKTAGKVIISLPQALISAEQIQSSEEKFNEKDFPSTETYAKVLVGKTKFPLYDIKNLEKDDLVVFENSKINKLTLSVSGENLDVNINPNMDLLIPDMNDGGNDMGETHNIWDSIEVDMYAEFDAVKITLGELKNIEDGLVVDLTSLYDNKVTLKVEGKPIASGSLVIVNDRYGVKIDNILTDAEAGVSAAANKAPKQKTEENEEEEFSGGEEENSNEESVENDESSEENEGNEDFDYSDFELEDENI